MPAATDAAGVPPRASGLSPAVLRLAFVRAVGLVLLLVGAAWLAGLLPPGGEGMALLGVGAAIVASGAAVLLKGGFLGDRAMATMHGDGRLLASRLQSIFAASLVLKLFVVTAGVLVLRAQQVKFELVTTFAVAFAAASLVGQVTVAGSLWRALSRRPYPALPAGGGHPAGNAGLSKGGPS